MITRTNSAPVRAGGRNDALDRRLDEVGWGAVLVLTGGLWLFPEEQVPQGTWLVGIGLILLAIGFLRSINGLPAHVLTTVLGALALAAGLSALAGVEMPLFAMMLIVIGASVILRPMLVRRR